MDTRELERELRRNQDTLSSVGLGVMAFGAWSVIETVILFIIQIPKQAAETVESEYVPAFIAVAGVMLLVLLAADLLLRVYVGRSARAEWRQGGQRKGYLFAAGFLALISLASLVFILLSVILPGKFGTGENTDTVTIAVIELTSLITLIEMIAAGLRVRRIRRELESRQG